MDAFLVIFVSLLPLLFYGVIAYEIYKAGSLVRKAVFRHKEMKRRYTIGQALIDASPRMSFVLFLSGVYLMNTGSQPELSHREPVHVFLFWLGTASAILGFLTIFSFVWTGKRMTDTLYERWLEEQHGYSSVVERVQ